MKKPSKYKSPRLQAKDFGNENVHADQDWRYLMFFQYLRISPSYLLASECNSKKVFSEKVSAGEGAADVWQTFMDIGDVYKTHYRDWWLTTGLWLFGQHSARPRAEKIGTLKPNSMDHEILTEYNQALVSFINNKFAQQGKPNSLILSVPLLEKRTTVIKQINKLLDTARDQLDEDPPQPEYQIVINKMRYKRLLAGLRLVYMKAAKPNDELWRVATRAGISHTHGKLDPLAQKKDLKSAQSRRMLTIMASRLLHDTLVISENAARGTFPCIKPVVSINFNYKKLRGQLSKVHKWENSHQPIYS